MTTTMTTMIIRMAMTLQTTISQATMAIAVVIIRAIATTWALFRMVRTTMTIARTITGIMTTTVINMTMPTMPNARFLT